MSARRRVGTIQRLEPVPADCLCVERGDGGDLALLFQTLQPLSKPDRSANIALGVRAMSNEESHYWFAKVLKGKRSQALRVIWVVLGD